MNNHNKQSVVDTLTLMIQEMEIIQKLHIDNVPMTVRKKSSFFTRTRKKGINLWTIELLIPNDNYGEISVNKYKLLSSKLIIRRNAPLQLWYYALTYMCELQSIMVSNIHRNKERSGYEIIFENTLDFSECVKF